tara:strand:+ start:12 stop:743 length:732 start_codon:yes stop_codon:yes gene_type:complete
MKKYLILFLSSFILSQGVGLNLSLIGHLPQEEFKTAGVTTGFGIDFNGMYYMVDELAFGINFGGSVYDISRRPIPLNYYTDLITITEETSNNIAYGHLFMKVVPFQTKVKPFFEGLIGLKNLNTKTKVYSQDCTDDPDTDHDECEIAKSTNASDNAFSYGFGGGFEIQLIDFNSTESGYSDIEAGNLSFLFSFRYLYGNEARYLKKGSIEYTNPEDGPVTTTFNWSQSRTDLIQLNFGLQMTF